MEKSSTLIVLVYVYMPKSKVLDWIDDSWYLVSHSREVSLELEANAFIRFIFIFIQHIGLVVANIHTYTK